LKRGAGAAELEGIGRFNAGKSLIAILSPDKLFGHEAFETALAGEDGGSRMSTQSGGGLAFEKFLLFTLADEIYGLPLGAVDEVIRLPDSITRIPNAPDFVLGVVNMRGKALPLIDQRSRFGTVASSAKPRAIIVTLGDLQAGFVVDGVSEIVSVPTSDLAPSPDFSSEATAVFDRIAHIEVDGRMILVIDPKELLSRAERDLVSAMTDDKTAAETP
jgi:purine-binding chemotaxis protein CheW